MSVERAVSRNVEGCMAMSKVHLASRPYRLIVPAVPAVAGVVAGIVGLAKFHQRGNTSSFMWEALLLASVAFLVVLVLIDLVAGSSGPANRKRYGWVSLVLGADGRVSTSKTPILLWTAGVASAALYLTAIVVSKAGHDPTLLFGGDWSQYLLLLGGPFAAGVLAQVAVTSKINSGSLQKTLTPAASPSAVGAQVPTADAKAQDVVSDDAGDLDLVDSQYLIFNVVAFLYVAGAFVSRVLDRAVTDPTAKFSLPKIPSVLLAMTSLSAATYVANKATQQAAPAISALSPPTPTSGAVATILGVNLLQPDVTSAAALAGTRVIVTEEASPANVVTVMPLTVSATTAQFTMPPAFAGKKVTIQVLTAANVATGTFAASVL